MAIYNEIGIGRWNRFIQKLTDMKGGPPARQLSSEISFNHMIASGRETRYLEQWDSFAIQQKVAAVAANQSAVMMRNPRGSNVVAVFEKMLIFAVGNIEVFISQGATNADLAVVAPNSISRLDARGRPSPTLIQSSANNAAAIPTLTNGVADFGVLANTNWDFIYTDIQEMPLLPGDALQWQTVNVNVQLLVSLMWRERFLEPAERF